MLTNDVTDTTKTSQPYSLRHLILYFLKLGAFRFGGPVALVESMHVDLVGEGKPFTEMDYRLGLALSQLAPGPLAAQLVSYFGWVAGGFWGSLIVSLVFVFPSFLVIVVLAQLYVTYSDSAWLRVLSNGAAPVVVALIVKSGWSLFKKTDLKRSSFKIIFIISLSVTVIYREEVAWVFLLAAFLPTLLRGKYANWAVLPPLAMNTEKLWEIFKYFIEIGSLVFGSGLVIVPFLYGGVVHDHGWLTETQFIDAIAAGMITPGPIVITVAFIGYLVQGLPGAFASALGMFLPCFLLVVVPAPYFKKLIHKNPSIMHSVDGLSVAALGAIFGGAILIIQKNLQSWPQQLAAVVALILATRFRKIPDPVWIVIGLAIGWAVA